MLVAVSAAQIVAVIAAALAATVLTAAIGVRFRLGRWEIVIGAGCIGLLMGFVAADLVIPGVGRWWAARPIAAAALAGLLLLAVTVLVVETLIETVDERRLAPAGRAAMSEILNRADDRSALSDVGSAMWYLAKIRQTEYPHDWVALGAPGSFEVADEDFRAALRTHAPVLTSSDRLTILYNLALAVSAAIHRLRQEAVEYSEGELRAAEGPESLEIWLSGRFEQNRGERQAAEGPESFEMWRSERRRAMVDAWRSVVESLDELERRAGREIGLPIRPRSVWQTGIASLQRPFPTDANV